VKLCKPLLELGPDTDIAASISALMVNRMALITTMTTIAVQVLLMLLVGPYTMTVLGVPAAAMLLSMLSSLFARACVSSKAADSVKKMQMTASWTIAYDPTVVSQDSLEDSKCPAVEDAVGVELCVKCSRSSSSC
jgi:hypothetical protein